MNNKNNKNNKSPNKKVKIKVFSKNLKPNKPISNKFICTNQGCKDLSPYLSWKPVKGAASYVLLVFDPDAPSGTWFHWILPSISKKITKIPVLPSNNNKVLEIRGEKVIQGKNSWNKFGYGGPCPPPGEPHRYYFVVYALDTVLENANINSNKIQNFLAKIQPHVIGYGHLKAIYQRN